MPVSNTNYRSCRTSFWLFIVVLAVFSGFSQASEICYLADGQVAAQDVPCNSNGTTSLCCEVGQACTKAGLCLISSQDDKTQRVLGRGSCTDKTWNSPECPKLCTGHPSDVLIRSCNETVKRGQFCCGEKCTCRDSQPTFYVPGDPFLITVNITSPTNSSTTPSASAALNYPKASTGETIGLAVGLGAAGALIIGFGILHYLRYRKQALEKKRVRELERQHRMNHGLRSMSDYQHHDQVFYHYNGPHRPPATSHTSRSRGSGSMDYLGSPTSISVRGSHDGRHGQKSPQNNRVIDLEKLSSG